MAFSCQLWVGFCISSGTTQQKPRNVSFQQGEDVFMVLASTLVIPPQQEEAVACDASKAGQCSGLVCRVDRWAVQCPSMQNKGLSGVGRRIPLLRLCCMLGCDQQCPFCCRHKRSSSWEER